MTDDEIQAQIVRLEGIDNFVAHAPDKRRAFARMCDPTRNVDAAAWFITTLCRTLDEERPVEIAPIARWPFVLDLIADLEQVRLHPENLLIDKSRRMLGTWVVCAYMLWRSQWTKGFPAFATTGKGGDYVDDGGDHSTPKSVFGRLRFMYDRLPEEARKSTDFAFKRVVCTETDAYISGESPTEQGGRAGGYAMAFVDEAAFVPYSESLNRALDPACRRGRVYLSTPNGSANVFARIIRTRPKGWRIHQLDWTKHPGLNAGLVDTPEGELDRYGEKVSPRFREITESLRDEDIAQEYLHSLERSLRGLIYKEFNLRKHVAPEPLLYDPDRPVLVGVDYGSSGFGAACFGQMHGEKLHVIADYELEGAGGAEVHARNEWDVLLDAGYRGECGDPLIVGGPDTDAIQTGSGQTIAGYYRRFGFTNIRQSMLRGPGSVDRGITVVSTALRRERVLISPTCLHLVDRFSQYRWPVERGTGRVRPTKPAEGDANHIMDAFRYLVTECFPREDASSPLDNFTSLTGQTLPESARTLLDDYEDDAPRLPGLLGGRRGAIGGY